MKQINFSRIERKWQKQWESRGIFKAREGRRRKYYIVEMYPYPSGFGLHMGHAFNYTIGDVQARLRRMQGFNVLYPMGYDSFGLPAENAAIKAKSHPKRFTEQAIKNYIKQQKELGLSYDWSRLIVSHDPEFYKWDQWIFLKMFEKGLAYKKKAPVNFCKKCNTVLANEQVVNGKCWIHEDSDVEVKLLEQWFLRITDYADELYEGIDKLDGWPDLIKTLQKNWINKSHGTEIDFFVGDKIWKVFTTRADTLFGVTFLVVSAQHPDLMALVSDKQKKEVDKFLRKVRSVSDKDLVKLDKEGVFTGSYALHPLTEKRIPVWLGNFIVADYGSGMVMAVPAHDQRDFEFAKKYGLEIREVVRPKGGKKFNPKSAKEAYTGFGILGNSGGFGGLKSQEAIQHITNALEMKHKGRKAVGYRLKDWLISRQRFWGTPIPIIYCNACGIVLVLEKDLPVKLPENIKFSSKGNPLVGHDKFMRAKCPKCGKIGRRESDTMDTFVNSSWYFLRYCDPKNKKKIFDSKKANYWMPIDNYIGGKEHACLHLIYFRFYTKFLRDIGLLRFDEPVKRLFNQGMLHAADGRKMSKSYGNVVLPDEAAKKYGVDAMRMFLISVASPDKDFNWSDKGAEGSLRFVLKVMNFVDDFKNKKIKSKKMTKLQESKLHRAIRDYTDDLEVFGYNLGVIKLRALFDVLREGCDKRSLEIFLRLFSVICPHVAEEMWEKLGNRGFVSLEKWPKFDKKKIDDKLEEIENQINKLIDDIRNIIKIVKGRGKKVGRVYLYVLPQEKKNYDSEKLVGRLGIEVIIFAVNDKGKYDPEGKAKKAKPGRPGIFLE
ncbi:MAG: leucine--tRNA ligase [Nanoarchaeota archaeon]|nr:leucine--tRNA ligase [Nanoarchaeota archaeon]